MTQQLNLCRPVFLTPKRYFSAQAMLRIFVGFLLMLSATCGYAVWQLEAQSAALTQAAAPQALELKALQSALEERKRDAGSVAKALSLDVQAQQQQLRQRERLLAALNLGRFAPGEGHSDRLKLVALSIPAQVWLTQIRADDGLLQLVGVTLETAPLNEWVRRLEASPVLAGQKLTAIKVEQSGGRDRPHWNFTLVSALAQPTLAQPTLGAVP